MDTTFVNSENRKTSKPHVLILKLTKKLELGIGEKIIALSNLSIHYTNLKYLHQHEMLNLNYQMDRIQYQTFKVILNTF